MQSVMKKRFSEQPTVDLPRSRFDLSHGYKTTIDAGWLCPIFCDTNILPGDTWDVKLHGFSRLATPTFPIMDNMQMETFFFFVPHRLVWNNFHKLMGERENPGDSISYTVPIINDINNEPNMSLTDYFGLPTQIGANYAVNSFAYRAYALIWNEWFRDQNLQDQVTVDKDDGPDTIADYDLLRRGKRHDYFSSCLPWLQKGDAVSLPLGIDAPIAGIGVNGSTVQTSGSITLRQSYNQSNSGNGWWSVDTPASAGQATLGVFEDPSNPGYPFVYADLTNSTAANINNLREAVHIQRLLEKDARSGTRYTEIIQSHFGVTSADQRLQRPEYLGGGSSPINITPIARTDSSPGELGAHGQTFFDNHGFIKSFTEHGTIIGMVCVRADMTYQEGIERHWSKSTRYDFYWPTLAHLGEQAVLNKEIYVDATTLGSGATEEVWGYNERWAEYRYKQSKITGKLRSNDLASLDAWHLGIEFGAQPTLDDTYIQEDPPIDRVIATPSEPHFIFDSFFNINATRPLPVYSIPGLTDRF
jgi:hypothetical protein